MRYKALQYKRDGAPFMFCSKGKSRRAWTSFGVAQNFLTFMDDLDRITIQLANKFFYDIAVSRV